MTFPRNLLASSVLAASISAAASAADAHEICWIEKVNNSPAGLRVFLISGYKGAVETIVRKGSSQQAERVREVRDYFELSEGDVAYLRGGVHDSCTLIAARRNGRFGIEATAASRPNGFPLSRAEAFLPGVD